MSRRLRRGRSRAGRPRLRGSRTLLGGRGALGGALVPLIVLVAFVLTRVVQADGGVAADARRDGAMHAVAFVQPMVPRVGVIDVSVLLSPTPPESLHGPLIRATHLESSIERLEVATPAHQGNRLLRSALIALPRAGRWRIEVEALHASAPQEVVTNTARTERVAPQHDPASPAPDDTAPRAIAVPPAVTWPALRFEIEVAPELPSWRSQWPWLLAWIPLTVLLLWRDRLIQGRWRPRPAERSTLTVASRRMS